jgi:rhodanese-related sulfurtransferase
MLIRSRLNLLTPYCAILLFLACVNHASAQGQIDDATLMEAGQKTPEISTTELRRILYEHSATVLDARPFMEYALGHIPGALNAARQPGVPMSLYISDVDDVGRIVHQNTDTPIILYCNGPFCDKSKRLADRLLAQGYGNVKRYQLGMPVWRALGGLAQIELAGVAFVLADDRTAVLIDAREPAEFARKTLPGAKNVPRSKLGSEKNSSEIRAAKDDGRLPMEDHNTRIIVFGDTEEQSRTVADALAHEGFSNVAFFGGSFEELLVAAAADKQK